MMVHAHLSHAVKKGLYTLGGFEYSPAVLVTTCLVSNKNVYLTNAAIKESFMFNVSI